MTAEDARSLTRKAVRDAADAARVEEEMDRWFAGVRDAARKAASFFAFEATAGPTLDECVRQMEEAGFKVGDITPGPQGAVLVETTW